MIRYIFFLSCLVILTTGEALAQDPLQKQFVLVAQYGSFSVVNDSTFTGTVIFPNDQLGEGYLPTAIDSGFIAIGGLRRVYRIDSVANAGLSEAELWLVELEDNDQAPIGVGQVYEPDPEDPWLIPPPPVNSNGVSPAYLSGVSINNLRGKESLTDSTRLVQDSILVYYFGPTETGRDTIRTPGSGGSGVADSTRLVQDSILLYFQAGVEIGRDTIRTPGEGTDNQNLTYNGSGNLEIERGNSVDLSDLIDLVDSTRLLQDSILVYFNDGVEVGRDTIRPPGSGGGVNYAFRYFSDDFGFSQATADEAEDILKFRSPDGSIDFAAWDDDPTYGDYLAFEIGLVKWSVLTNEVQDSILLARGVDSTRLLQDSILLYYQAGVEIGRDTIRTPGSGGGGSDGNGIFDAANDNGTIPPGFNANLTDSLIIGDGVKHFQLGGPTLELKDNLIFFNGSSSPAFIDFDLSGDPSNSFDLVGPSGSGFSLDPDGLSLTAPDGNIFSLQESSVSQNMRLHINPDNGTGLALIQDSRPTTWGLEYAADYRSGYRDRTLPDWGNVKDTIETAIGNITFPDLVEFPDNTFRIYDDVDTTRILALDAGSITTGNTRTYIAPDKDGTIALLSDLDGLDSLDGNGIISALPLGDVNITSIPDGNYMFWQWVGGTYYDFNNTDFELDAPLGTEFDFQIFAPNEFSNFYVQTGGFAWDQWADRFQLRSINSDLYFRADTTSGFQFTGSDNDRFLFEISDEATPGLDTVLYMDEGEIAYPSLSAFGSLPDSLVGINGQGRIGKVATGDIPNTNLKVRDIFNTEVATYGDSLSFIWDEGINGAVLKTGNDIEVNIKFDGEEATGVSTMDDDDNILMHDNGEDRLESILMPDLVAQIRDSIGSGGHVIENEGVPLVQRDTLNFIGLGVDVTDSGGKTVVDIESNRLNIEDTEYSIKPTNQEPTQPTQPENFDYFIDPSSGNDSDPGTSRADAFLTTAPINTLMSTWAGKDTVDILLMEGTHTGTLTASGSLAGLKVFRFWTSGEVIIDRDLSTSGGDSGFNVGGTNNEFQIIGPLVIRDIQNNAIGTFSTAKVYAWNIDIINADDGLSAHNTSKIYATNINIKDCRKYAIAHINTTETYHWRVKAQGKIGATGGVSFIDSGAEGYYYDCLFLPPPSAGIEPPQSVGVTLYENCFFGSDTMSGTWSNYAKLENSTIKGSYFNLRLSFYDNTHIHNGYGKLTVRPRGPITDTLTITNSTFSGAYESGRFLNFNFYSPPTEIGGVIVTQDLILTNLTEAFYAVSSSAGTHVDTAYVLNHNLLYANTTNYTNITASPTDITGDPLLYNSSPTSTDLYEYTYPDSSIAVNAGYNGDDVGVGETNKVFAGYSAQVNRDGEIKVLRQGALSTITGATDYTASDGVKLVVNDFRLDIPGLVETAVDTADFFTYWDVSAGVHRKAQMNAFGGSADQGLRYTGGVYRLGMPSANWDNPLELSRQINLGTYDLMFTDSSSTAPGSVIIGPEAEDAGGSYTGKLHIKGDPGLQPHITIGPRFGIAGGSTALAGEIRFHGNTIAALDRYSSIKAYGIGDKNSLSFWVNQDGSDNYQALDIRYDGNVGIGTEGVLVPDRKLEVVGDFQAGRLDSTSVVIDTSGYLILRKVGWPPGTAGPIGSMIYNTYDSTIYVSDSQDWRPLAYKHPATDSIQAAATTVYNFENASQKILKIGCSGVATISTLTLNNMIDGGTYTLHFRSVTSTSVTFPSNFYNMDETSVGTLALTGARRVTFYWDGQNAYLQ